ncbi:MAG: glycosyltransferase family 9 protein [Candidatus Omnitrophica bacterium]|nr:glycosyltransferase family 9 protein [Candidatus Omnitrophota bacterium]
MKPSAINLNSIHRILITRTDRIGDLVLSTPVFSEIRKKFPKAWIACLTYLENKEIVCGNPYLDEIILYDKKGSEKGIWGNLLFSRALSKKKFDLVIHLHATNRMHWTTWLAGIPVRIGWNRKWGSLLTHPYPDLKKEGKKHEAEYNFELLAPLGISQPCNLETFFPVSEKSKASLEELLRHHHLSLDKPWVVISPSASCLSKIWSAERFGILSQKILAEYDVCLIIIGTRSDHRLIQKIKNAAPETGFYDLSGKLSLGMLGALLKNSALLISNDSGPTHIASAVGTPVISIFGRKQPGLSPARWRPLGARSRVIWKDVGCVECLAHNCQIHFLCLDAISVQDVFKEVEFFHSDLSGLKEARIS